MFFDEPMTNNEENVEEAGGEESIDAGVTEGGDEDEAEDEVLGDDEAV